MFYWLKCENRDTKETWFSLSSNVKENADLDAKDAKRFWPHLEFTVITDQLKNKIKTENE